MNKIQLIIRILFGIGLLFFGTNHLFHYLEPPAPPADALPYWQALTESKTMMLVGIIETLAGVSLLLNKYVALLMLVLLTISVNAVLYHFTLDSKGLPMGITLLVLNIILIYFNKDKYKELQKAN